jgi:hypothetical protein
VKISLGLWMHERPVGFMPILRLDHAGDPGLNGTFWRDDLV